jgi:hypothetical protein
LFVTIDTAFWKINEWVSAIISPLAVFSCTMK